MSTRTFRLAGYDLPAGFDRLAAAVASGRATGKPFTVIDTAGKLVWTEDPRVPRDKIHLIHAYTPTVTYCVYRQGPRKYRWIVISHGEYVAHGTAPSASSAWRALYLSQSA